MGETIRKGAAADDIIADGKTTLTKAQARGGAVQSTAEARLSATITLADTLETRIAAARAAADPAQAALERANDVADDVLGRIADDVWNEIGRPASDGAYDLLFPGGYAAYAEGDVHEQPDRMDLLAELFLAKLHPKLPADRATALAAEITASSTTLRALADTARPLATRLALVSKMKTAVARSLVASIAGLKRQWKADGISEADIHAIIPDRPRPKKAEPSSRRPLMSGMPLTSWASRATRSAVSALTAA